MQARIVTLSPCAEQLSLWSLEPAIGSMTIAGSRDHMELVSMQREKDVQGHMCFKG